MIKIYFSFAANRRALFKSGRLIEEWATRYPQIFDSQDITIARNQPDRHFYEWLAAILFYESSGYLSLIEKYQTKSHTRKIDVFKRCVSSELFADACDRGTGTPDLFVYAPDCSDWFLCEVKGDGDRLSREQVLRADDLEELSGRPVRLLWFKEIGSR